MSAGDSLLAQLTERPFDPALRQVYADWLLDQGDARGEVIALSAVAHPTLTQRRRVQRLVERHARAWLGPLMAVADVAACGWEGGFLDHLVVAQSAGGAWAGLVGEPRLCTVRALRFPPHVESAGVEAFLAHEVLRHVRRLELGLELLRTLADARLGFSPEVVALTSWGTLDAELRALGAARWSRGPRALELVTTEFVGAVVAGEVRASVLANEAVAGGFETLRLAVRYGVVEGVAAWLNAAPRARLRALERWEVDSGGVRHALHGSRFEAFDVDLSGQGDGALGLGQRVAAAAAVLVQLAPAALERVTVKVPVGAVLRRAERDALTAAVRRLRTVTSFEFGLS